MASDASRRWLDGSGILSCRIKLPITHLDDLKSTESNSDASPAMAGSLRVPADPASPSSRRKDKIAEAMQSMGMGLNNTMEPLEMPTDADAQATVTDFLDFTEYLPSDMIRSLTLIGNLDQKYVKAAGSSEELTKMYGKLPDLPAGQRPQIVPLRGELSRDVAEAVSARNLAHAEAARMAENVDRHYNRAKNILAKLQIMLETYPPSRESSPVPQRKSPAVARTPKIALKLSAASGVGEVRIRRHRAPRITVPGEVLAPYELDYETYGSESDTSDSDDEPLTPRSRTPARGSHRIKLTLPKLPKNKVPKPSRAPRPPGALGTNVHSSVAGISTSNALAKLEPPPDDAPNGSVHRPWLQLTAYELAKLRKRMKKNAVWSPSDTMIARELKNLGRGIEAYRAAKSKAENEGQPFDQPEPPQLQGVEVDDEGAISVSALAFDETQLVNRGMKLNEAKKLKKENQAKEMKAAEEAVQSARKMAEVAIVFKGLFGDGEEHKLPTKTPSKATSKTPARKRKREEEENEPEKSEEPLKSARPQLKRNKTETPVPVPIPLAKQITPVPAPESAPSVTSHLTPVSTPAGTPSDSLPVRAVSPKKSSTPILPPTKELRKPAATTATKKEVKKPEPLLPITTATNTRTRRSSTAVTPIPVPSPIPVPEPITATILLPPKRPTSSRSKASSPQPNIPTGSATIDRPRRTSTARNTPAPAPAQEVKNNKRTKRPAPGVVTAARTEGGDEAVSVSVGKRRAATSKKAGGKKKETAGREGSAVQEQEVLVEVDDEGNLIDPDEPRYCLCNRVSFGTMIGCENADCEKEWFHLECVGLMDIPPRTTKWYCPECRVTLGIGEKGEVNARGKKK